MPISQNILQAISSSTDRGPSKNTFTTFKVSGQSDVVADSTNSTLTYEAGNGVSLVNNATNRTMQLNLPNYVVSRSTIDFISVSTGFFSTNSTSWVDWPGMTITITPKNVNNSFKISFTSQVSNDSDNSFQFIRLLRNGVVIAQGDPQGTAQRCISSGEWGAYGAAVSAYSGKPLVGFWQESPAISAALTYKLQVIRTLSGTAYFGYPPSAISPDASSILSTMFVEEVAG